MSESSVQTPSTDTVAAVTFHAGWDRWIAENLLAGVAVHKLRTVLLRRGFDVATIEEHIAGVVGHPYFKLARDWAGRQHKLTALMTTLSHLRDGQQEVIDVVPDLRPDDFYAKYVRVNRPVLAKGLIKSWPAVGKWTGEYFLEKLGNVAIEISDARDADPYFEEHFGKHTTTVLLSDFVSRLASSSGNNFYLCAKHNFLSHAAAGALTDDFAYPPGFLDESVSKTKASLWMGPQGTWTPFHHDASNILFCQVRGTKTLFLCSPIHLPRLYNDRKCFSDVDPRGIDLDRFPDMAGVPFGEVTVETGDALFIPVGWWHCVEAQTLSISLSLSNFLLPRNANVWAWR